MRLVDWPNVDPPSRLVRWVCNPPQRRQSMPALVVANETLYALAALAVIVAALLFIFGRRGR